MPEEGIFGGNRENPLKLALRGQMRPGRHAPTHLKRRKSGRFGPVAGSADVRFCVAKLHGKQAQFPGIRARADQAIGPTPPPYESGSGEGSAAADAGPGKA